MSSVPGAVLATPRLILREMTDADLDDVAALLGDPDVMRHYPAPKSRDESRAWIDRNRGLYRERGFGLWAVTLRGTGEFAGDCGLTPQRVDGAEHIEVGYHIRADLQGNGYATEAAAACRDFARDALGLRRLIAIIDPTNVASRRVAAKIGLRPEGEAVVSGLRRVIYAGC
jgi:RimJ/RimL family protein N-acetyltransferase